jgi:hypothetical protein
MSYTEKAIDRVPFIPYAGSYQGLKSKDNNIGMNLKPDLYFPPKTTTPDNIKKYRDSLRQRVGVKQLHPGIYDDPKDYESLRHGITTKSSDHVPDVIKGLNLNGNNSFMNELSESRYASNKREPLGKSIVRNYKFPEVVKSADFKFGIPTTGILNAKNLIYYGAKEEPEEVKNLYYKSHGITDPGKPNMRYYKWNFDPNKHTFGYAPKLELDGAKNSLKTDTLTNPYPQTLLSNRRVENFRAFNNPLLGKSKFHGSLNPKFYDENHVFGKGSKLGDQWNAGRCLHGDETTVNTESVKPDDDLGRDWHYASKLKSLRPTQNNLTRAYGVPTIRRDLPKRIVKSVTDIKNYGDEPDAYDLLYPHPEAIRGVYDEDFEKLFTKEEIYTLMKKYDFIIPEKEYDLMFEVAIKNYPNNEGKISPKSFISTMRNLKREYQKYRVLEIN